MKRVLLTGGAGFLGHHVAAHILATTDAEIVFLDRLDFAGNLCRIAEIDGWDEHRKRCWWIWHDLKAEINLQLARQIGPVDTILHVAAATHVDRSITDPMSFVLDNVVGTTNLLNYARQVQPEAFLYFGTDEVFGPAPNGVAYREWDRYHSKNPYAATKAAAEELCLAYHNTYGVPVYATHCMNIFGPRQHQEKYIPSTIGKVARGEVVTIHADAACKIPGSRFYIHAQNVADAVLFVLEHGSAGDKFNIVGEREVDNLTLARMIADIQGKPLRHELVNWHASRPGHDLRYALDGSKLAAMGWKPPTTFEASLERMVKWTLANPRWM